MKNDPSETFARRVRLSTKSILAALFVTLAAAIAVILAVEKRLTGSDVTVDSVEPAPDPQSALQTHRVRLAPASGEAGDQRLRPDQSTH